MASLFQWKEWTHPLLLFMVYLSICKKNLGFAIPRNAPFCIDADETKEDMMFKSERFKPIILHHNQNNPPIKTWIAGPTPEPNTDYITDILLTRLVVDDSILPTTNHTMRNLRNWVHITIRPSVELEGFYMQAIKAPLGVPFGDFAIDFECKDCYSIAINDPAPSAQIVPCKGRPKSSPRHPNALVVAGDVDASFVKTEGLHFHFNWIESLCDDVPLFQFLIVAVKSWGGNYPPDFGSIDYQIFYSPVYENEMADSWTGVPWPLDPTWKHNDTIACHGNHTLPEEPLGVKVSTVNASGILRINEEYDNCLVNNAMEDGYQCPPGPFTCPKPPLTKNEWITRRQLDIQNSLKLCESCNAGNSTHGRRKRESLDEATESGDENDSSSTEDFDEDTEEVDGSTDEPEAAITENILEENNRDSKASDEYVDPLDDSKLDGEDYADSILFNSPKLYKFGEPRSFGHVTSDPDMFSHDNQYSSSPSVRDDTNFYPYGKTNPRRIKGRKIGKNNSTASLPIQKSDPKMSATVLNYFRHQTQQLLKNMVVAHSILMVLCWCTFAAISSYVARYQKEVSTIVPGSGCFGMGTWLWGHVIYSYLCLCAMWAGLLLILPYMVIEVGSYGKKSFDKNTHIALGATAMVLFHFNHVLGWYRPLSPYPRGIYILVHVVFGLGSNVIAVIAAFKTSLPSGVTIYIALAEIFYIVMCVIASIIQCKIDKEMNLDPPRSYYPVLEAIDTYEPDFKETSGINVFFLYLQNPVLLYVHYFLQFSCVIIFSVLVCKVE